MKKAWICFLAVFLLLSAFSFAGAAENTTIANGNTKVDLGSVSISAGENIVFEVAVNGIVSEQPVEFSTAVMDAGAALPFSLNDINVGLTGENVNFASSLILVGGYPVTNGFSAVGDSEPFAAPLTISGKIVAIDASKPMSVKLNLAGQSATAVTVSAAQADISIKNIDHVVEGASLKAVCAAVNLDKEFTVEALSTGPGPVVVPTTEVPTTVPTNEVTNATQTTSPTTAVATTAAPSATATKSPVPFFALIAGLAAAGLVLSRK